MTARFGWLMIGLTLTFLASISVPSTAVFKYLEKGMKAPVVRGEDIISGKKIFTDTNADDVRETILIAFWASWSPRSPQLMADLKDLSARLSDHPFRVIAINVDDQKMTKLENERVRQIVIEQDPPFPVIIDEKLRLYNEFGVVAVPSLVILDANRIICAAPSGYSYTTREQMIKLVETMLGLRSDSEKLEIDQTYQPKSKASSYYHSAVQLANQHLYERAMANLILAVNEDPHFSAPLSLMGRIQLRLGEVEAALEHFRQAVALDSVSVSARVGLGRALLETDHPAEALRQLKKALDLDPSHPYARLDLARSLLAGRQPERAVSAAEEIIELDVRDPQLYFGLGIIYRETGYSDRALKAYQTALEMLFPEP